MRKKLTQAAAVLAALAGLYAAVWWVGAWYLGGLVDDWIAKQREAGWTIRHTAREKTGFPLKWRSRITGPAIAGPAGEGRTINWRGPYMIVQWSPWQPRQLILRSSGKHQLTGTGKDFPPRIDLELHKIILLIGLGRGLPRNYAVKADGVTVAPPGKPPVTLTRAVISTTLLDTEKSDKQLPETAKISADLYGLTLPEGIESPLGRTISRLSLEAGLAGETRPGKDRAETLSLWRDSGGVVDVRKFEAGWGTVALKANGTLALDKALRPLAAMRIDVTGYQQALDVLARTGKIRPSQLLLLRFGLRALSSRGKSGEEKISVPVAAQDGWLFVGPVKLVKLKPVID